MEFECTLAVNGKQYSFKGNAEWKGIALGAETFMDWVTKDGKE